MKVWFLVEGRSDTVALSALWSDWKKKLEEHGWGLRFVILENKPKYLRKVGVRTTEKLQNDNKDLVIGLPDLYPNKNFRNTEFSHRNLLDLQNLQIRLVRQEVKKRVRSKEVESCLSRFYASAMKFDLEMLILAAHSHLQERLGLRSLPKNWRVPPEDQNQNKPPKKIVQQLFMAKLKRSYREITDCQAILSNTDILEVLYDENNRMQCPAFCAMLDWIGSKTGVTAY